MPMTLAEMKENPRKAPKCPKCGEPFEPRVDGKRHTLGGEEVCDDCYFGAMGKEVEQYPIVKLGPHH